MAKSKVPSLLLAAAQELVKELASLSFASPVEHLYNPLDYVWDGYEKYVTKYSRADVEVLFLGMNPGPWGMAQTGVPFGEVNMVRDWLGIVPEYSQPKHPHPLRPISGVDCPRSEVSGLRMWGLFQKRYGKPSEFFKHNFVANYCPLAFMESSARNRTPDKLPAKERARLYQACDKHLVSMTQVLKPKWIVGVGQFAEDRAKDALSREHTVRNNLDRDTPGSSIQIVRILHPSPASPASNRDWAGTVTKQLVAAGIWDGT